MLKDRLISSMVWFLLLWFVIFVLPEWVFLLTTIAVISLGLYEFFNMVIKKGVMVYRYIGIIIGCLIPLTTYLQFKPTAEIEFLLITTVCLAVFLLQFTRQRTEQALFGIATTIFGIFYISWLFSFIIKLRITPFENLDGRFIVLYLLLVTKSGDITAYFVGTAFGKHQFMPRISPKKTVEGTLGGVIASVVMAVLFRNFLGPIHITHIFVIGIFLGIISQIGDLSESLIKRDCQVKDSGSLFPGLGGILDLIDSLLFTTPILYFYLRLIL